MKKSAIYPGTFDPLTLGHLDVIQRASLIFDRLIVAVAEAPKKTALFSLDERLQMARDAVTNLKGVEVVSFRGLLVEFARKSQAGVLVRGLRAFSDFEYEFQMALSNRKLAPDIETMFLMTSETYSYVSSSVVREVAELGGDSSELVPPNVQAALVRKLRKGRPAA